MDILSDKHVGKLARLWTFSGITMLVR